jgi:hypothetical protein
VSCGKVRIPLAEGRDLAGELVALLESTCERIEIAGSIRRERELVGDIELLAIPRITAEADMFGNVVPDRWTNDLDDLCAKLRGDGVLADRPDKNGRPAWGSRYKRARYKGVALDLFSVIAPATWGVLFMIRTGPADFSHVLVTSQVERIPALGCYGRLPTWAKVEGGALRYAKTGEPFEMPTEHRFFDRIGVEWVEPRDRDDWIARYIAESRRLVKA